MSSNIDWSTKAGVFSPSPGWFVKQEISYVQWGKVVIVTFDSVVFAKTTTDIQVVGSGLPPAKQYSIFSISTLSANGNSSTGRFAITSNGDLTMHFTTVELQTMYCGEVMYIAA